MTKQQIIDAVVECAEKLGHTPSHVELMQHTSVSRKQVRWHFGAYARLLQACNLAGSGSGYKVELDELFRDWAGIARDLKKMPTIAEYERTSQYSVRPLITRFGSWTQAPNGLKQYAEEQGWAEEWKDVLAIVEVRGEQDKAPGGLKQVRGPENTRRARRFAARQADSGLKRAMEQASVAGPDDVNNSKLQRAVYGPPMRPCPLVCGPVNEQGVVFLFGAMAEKLGFLVLRIQTEFPDCEALMQVEEDRWERVKIEFEYESRNFLKHMHEASGCDMIVCWRHNWPECPMDVVELRGELPKLP